MIHVFNERVIPCDIDDTLIHHSPVEGCRSVKFADPFDQNREITLWVNDPMVRIVTDEKARGAYIIVWSKGGNAWARAVIRALELTEYVDLIMTKPVTYLDDKDCNEWMKDRVYLPPTTIYKTGQQLNRAKP